MKQRIALLLMLLIVFCLPACRNAKTSGGSGEKPVKDPSGAEVQIPDTVETIVTLAPSLSQTVVDLGLGDRIVGYDLNSVGLEGLAADAATFDTVTPDVEALIALQPDVIFLTNLSFSDDQSPYQPLIDSGISVLCVPTSDSIEDVKSDIRFLASALDKEERGEEIISDMEADLKEIEETASKIPEDEKKSVYFEISAAPYMYSCGSGVYLNEMIELIGATNIFDDEGWFSVEAETVVAADPDVILTNVNYIDDPVGEIESRDGWSGITAVKNGDVYSIDNMASSLPNENIVLAAQQMAEAVYPEYFAKDSAE